MKDVQAIDWLCEKAGGMAAAAALLGVDPQNLYNWQTRGISPRQRPRFFEIMTKLGAKLPVEWMAAQPAPTKKEIRDGRARKAARKARERKEREKREGERREKLARLVERQRRERDAIRA